MSWVEMFFIADGRFGLEESEIIYGSAFKLRVNKKVEVGLLLF